jgi:hypothetical protein
MATITIVEINARRRRRYNVRRTIATKEGTTILYAVDKTLRD